MNLIAIKIEELVDNKKYGICKALLIDLSIDLDCSSVGVSDPKYFTNFIFG